ncbi:MAG TPA: pyrimidine dimer DNA glycosylase/endonuclease V [Rhodocyclaceae bacterium]
MRLWTLHPKVLDPRGLVALWREALLAQAVIAGQTRGYRHHPQLARFLAAPSPAAAIADYLRGVHEESLRRGYAFDASKIGRAGGAVRIAVPRGQLDYEWRHLLAKLRVRAPDWLAGLGEATRPAAHPLFRVVRGGIADWEIRR